MTSARLYATGPFRNIPPGTAPDGPCRKVIVGNYGYAAWFKDGSYLMSLYDTTRKTTDRYVEDKTGLGETL